MIGTRAPGSRDSQGFSLVEVIIAMGVLASVLISVASMFILGGRQVKAGKTTTEAVALCNDIMESFAKQSFTALYTNMGAASTDSTKTAASNVVTSPLAPWQTQITQKLANGVATATVTAIGPGTPTFGSAVGIQLTVTLNWNELARPESITISTIRF